MIDHSASRVSIDPDSDEAPIDRLVRPFEMFAGRPTAGVTVLLAATALAVLWANSPWAAVYESFRTIVRYALMGNTCERVLRSLRRSVLVTKPEGFVAPIERF